VINGNKVLIISGMPIGDFDCKDLVATSICPTWKLKIAGKKGSNKSDRKRNRKDRWR
jgi:hypothetical protein